MRGRERGVGCGRGSCMRGWDSCMCVKERGSYMRIFRGRGLGQELTSYT